MGQDDDTGDKGAKNPEAGEGRGGSGEYESDDGEDDDDESEDTNGDNEDSEVPPARLSGLRQQIDRFWHGT